MKKNRVFDGEYTINPNEWLVIYKAKCKNTCGTYDLIKILKVKNEKNIDVKINEKMSSSFYKDNYISHSVIFKEQNTPEDSNFLSIVRKKIRDGAIEYNKAFPPTEEEKEKIKKSAEQTTVWGVRG